MSCAVGHRYGSDPALLWLWCRTAATALIGPLAWEPPHAVGTALKRQKKKKKKRERINIQNFNIFRLLKMLYQFTLPLIIFESANFIIPWLILSSINLLIFASFTD